MTSYENEKFSMSEPQLIGIRTRYAFWLTATEDSMLLHEICGV